MKNVICDLMRPGEFLIRFAPSSNAISLTPSWILVYSDCFNLVLRLMHEISVDTI